MRLVKNSEPMRLSTRRFSSWLVLTSLTNFSIAFEKSWVRTATLISTSSYSVVLPVRSVVDVAEFPGRISPAVESGDTTVAVQHRAPRRVHIDTLVLIFRCGVGLEVLINPADEIGACLALLAKRTCQQRHCIEAHINHGQGCNSRAGILGLANLSEESNERRIAAGSVAHGTCSESNHAHYS